MPNVRKPTSSSVRSGGVLSCRSQFSRPVMRVLKERTFAHTMPHPNGAHRPSITQSKAARSVFRPPVVPRADLTGYFLDKRG